MKCRTAAFLLLLPISACTTVGPDFTPPAAPSAEAGYASDGGNRVALSDGPDAGWWKAFASPELDSLITQAIAGNHSLAASRATLEKARQQIAAATGRSLPQVDADGRGEYQRVNLAAFGLSERFGSADIPNPEFDLYTLGAGVRYDLDLFGRNRRAIEQAGAEAEAQKRATEAAHLVIAGRVTEQVLAIAALNDTIATQRQLLSEDERNLSLTQARQKAGAGTMVEVLTAQGQLAEDRANLPGLEQQLAQGRAMLAVLLGISPAELGPTDFSLDQFELPGSIPVALPSQLVRKRPDILEAEARLHASMAAVGVATADLYPNITLGATITQSTSQPQRIASSKFNAFDLFAGLTAPIFHGGTLKANKRGAEAEARAAGAQYQQIVTEAFGQVSSLLSALDNDAHELAARREAAEIAERSLRLSRRSFEVGNSGVLQVVDASRSYQRAKLALLATRINQYQNVARLYAATAGGWISPNASEPAN